MHSKVGALGAMLGKGMGLKYPSQYANSKAYANLFLFNGLNCSYLKAFLCCYCCYALFVFYSCPYLPNNKTFSKISTEYSHK